MKATPFSRNTIYQNPRPIKKLVLILLAVTIMSPGLYYCMWFATSQVSKKHTIIIERGAGTERIAELIASESRIDKFCLRVSLVVMAYLKHRYVVSGEYEFTSGTSGREIINKLIRGERVVRKLTIPEGYTNFQIITLLNKLDSLTTDITHYYLEGSLLPSTYHYYYGDSRQVILDRMKAGMDKFLEANSVQDHYKVLTLASIVEKEAKYDEERSIIASVYINRMKINMPLQADPTVIYGLFNGQTDYKHNLSKADLSIPSPYNTYINKGLPPTPIANPGKASILAVLTPASTPWLYFVSNGDGRHRFASTLADHNQNVRLLKIHNIS